MKTYLWAVTAAFSFTALPLSAGAQAQVLGRGNIGSHVPPLPAILAPLPDPLNPNAPKIGPDATPQLNRLHVPAPKERFALPARVRVARVAFDPGLGAGLGIGKSVEVANNTNATQNSTYNGGSEHSAVGITLDDPGLVSGTNVGVSATFTDYANVQSPSSWWTYSPTFREPGSGCLELTAAYPPNGAPFFGVWNWCLANPTNYSYTKTIDTNTFDHYYGNQNYGDGLPAFQAYTQSQADGEHVYLYNKVFSRWDQVDVETSTTVQPGSDGKGWNFYEYYGPLSAACVNYPATSARSIQVSTGGGTYQNITSTNNYNYVGGPANCFGSSGPSPTAIYYVNSIYDGTNWQVWDD